MRSVNVVLFLVVLFGVMGCGSESTTATDYDPESLSIFVAQYLAQPKFLNDDILEQLYGLKGAELTTYMVDEGQLYFTVSDKEERDRVSVQLCRTPSLVEWGEPYKGGIAVGSLVTYRPNVHFLRLPARELRVESSARVEVEYPGLTFWMTPPELADEIRNGTVYLGKKYLEIRGKRYVNFSAYVAKPSTAPLKRLKKALTENVPDDEIAQRLLDFVSAEIRYAEDEEAWSGGRQVVRKSSESVMTGEATCASKSVLYASLLEQAGIDYFLALYPRKSHAGIFVRSDAPAPNGYEIRVGEQRYLYAETTVSAYILGQTEIEGRFHPVQDLEFLCSPSRGVMLNAKTAEQTPLR